MGEAAEAWTFVRSVLDDMTTMVRDDAETPEEELEGLRVLARVTALCAELSVDVDHELPFVFPMSTPLRQVGGPNPDGEYDLCMIDGAHAYRLRGRRGTVTYLGFQVMAGRGLTPRRMAGYVSDRDLVLDADGRFELVLATSAPAAGVLGGATWVPIPEDASAIVVRQFIADRATEEPATYEVMPLAAPPPPARLDDTALAGQLTAMGWTIAKLMTLHRSVLPELLDRPNELVTAEAATLGSENTTPDNLYALGMFRLAPDEALVLDATPPDTRYWAVALETIWHECIEPRRRPSSITNARAVLRPDGDVRLVVAAEDPGVPNWLDTGGRHRGFVTFRWLDRPDPPPIRSKVVPVAAVAEVTV